MRRPSSESVGGDRDTGAVGDGMWDAPSAMAMELAVTHIAKVTTITAPLEPMERNANREQQRRREALAVAGCPRDRRSCMQLTAQQQPCELAWLHQTIALMANRLEMETAL